VHHYLTIWWLSFTKQFLNQLQYLMTIFSYMFDYLNSLINHTSFVPVNSDNWHCTIQTSILILCDPKRSRPDGACDMCYVGQCSAPSDMTHNYINMGKFVQESNPHDLINYPVGFSY